MPPKEQTIDATPHPDTISKVGEYGNYYDHQTSGRKGLPFAIAEKIDNSISATSGNSAERGRKINLYLLYDEHDKLVHMAVKDNGTGMDFEALQAYATYNLSQAARKEDMEGGKAHVPVALETGEVPGDDPRWTINGNIGHFGVGGQHAAFCIGKMEHVMTKVCQPHNKSSKPVLDFTMSTADMLKRRKEGKNCWQFPFKERRVNDKSLLTPEEKHPFLLKFVEDEPSDKLDSFTCMVVSGINDKVGPLLQPDGSDEAKYLEKLQPLLEELARVYHYYVHGKDGTKDLPEVRDDDDVSDGSDDSDDSDDDGGGLGKKRKKPSTRSDPKEPTPKKGAPAKKDAGSSSHSPRQGVKVEIVVHAIKQQGSGWKEMLKRDLAEVVSVEVKLHKAQKACLPVFFKINPNQGKKESFASLFLYYCPYVLDKETRPCDAFDKPDGPLFSCYWQGRLVPYAEITHLTIFDKLGHNKAFLKRVRGTIFFDRQIMPSNSKLQFHQSAQDTINNDAQCHRYLDWKAMVVEKGGISDQSRAVDKAITKWFAEAHQNFDREIRVEDYEVLDILDEDGKRTGEKETRFYKMIYAEQEYVKGAKMYFMSSKPHRYGKIEYFLCKGDISKQASNVTSTATVYYKRYPLELFGEEQELLTEPVSVKLLVDFEDKDWDAKVEKIVEKLPFEVVVLKHNEKVEYCRTEGRGKFQLDKTKDVVKDNLIESDFKDGFVTAGYNLPAVNVFVLNKKGKILNEIPTANDRNVKLKIQDTVRMTHEWSNGKNVAIARPKLISPVNAQERLQTKHEKNLGYHLDNLVECFLGAGIYELSYKAPILQTEGGEIVKNLSWKRTITVRPGEPHEAQFKTTAKVGVQEVQGGDYFIGAKVKKKIPRPIIFFITDKEGRDPDEPVYSRGNICILSDSEAKNMALHADVLKPEHSGLQLLFTTVSTGREPGEYMASLQVKMKEGEVKSTVRAALETASSVEVRFKLQIGIKLGKSRKTLTTTNEMVIRVRAGEPEKLVFHGDFSSEDEIEMQNRQLLQKIPCKAVDMFNNTVHFEGNDKGGALIVKRKLVPVYASSEAQKRKVDSHTLTVSAEKDASTSIFDLGGFRVHLDDPCVSRMEQHKLEVTATYRGRDIDCSNLELGLRISPSNLPHSVRPMWDDGEITQKGSDWNIPAPAGSEVTGVYFKLLDEAEDEVTDLRGWTVKWGKGGAKSFEGEATKMPPEKCREKANDSTEKTIVFTGPRGEETVAPTLSVSLTFVPYPTVPSAWKLVHPETLDDLPDLVDITVGEPLQKFFAVVLLDTYGNPINVNTLGQDDANHPLLTPVLNCTNDRGAFLQKTGVNDQVNYLNYDFDKPPKILPVKGFTLIGNAGGHNITVRTMTSSKELEKVKKFQQKIQLKAGKPALLKMEISGLPNDAEEAGKDAPRYSFGGPSAQGLLGSGVSSQTLSGLPSICIVKEIAIFVLDEVGNVLEKEQMINLKKKKLTLRLKNGEISIGKSMQTEISKPFSHNKKITFANVKLRAGKDRDGAIISDSELELSTDFQPFQVVRAPIKFSPSSAVVSVTLLPNPYTETFRVGQRLTKIIAQLRTEDMTVLEGSWKEGLTIKCFADQRDGLDEADNIFLPVPAATMDANDSDDTSDSAVREKARDNTTLYFMPGEGVLQHLGKHIIRAFWRETRPSVKALVGDGAEVKSNMLTFNVEPGAPHELAEVVLKSHVLLRRLTDELPTVSNKKGKNTIIPHLRLRLTDRMTNVCKMNSNLYVVASLHFIGYDAGPSEAEQDEEDSFEICHQLKFWFVDDWETSNLSHQAKQRVQNQLYEKQATLRNVTMEMKQLFSDLRLQEKKCNEQKQLLSRMLQEMDTILGDVTETMGKNLRGLPEDELRRLEESGHPFTRTVFWLKNTDDCTAARLYLRDHKADLGVRVPTNIRNWADQCKAAYRGVLGLLIDLIYMEDRIHANAVSVQCRAGLLTLIVESRDIARDITLKFKDLDVLALDYVTMPWRDVQNNTLMLHDQHKQPWASWMTSNAVVNKVRFHNRSHERLRAGAVKNLLGTVCIAENTREANILIEECKKYRARFPDLIVADENRRIRSSGVMRGGGQSTRNSDTSIATRQDIRVQQDKALEDLVHEMNIHRSLEHKLKQFEIGGGPGNRIQQLTDHEKVLIDEIQMLKDERERVVGNSKSSQAGPDVVEHSRNGTVPPELECDPSQSSAQGGAAVANDARKHTFFFNKGGCADIENLCIRPEHGNQQGRYKLLFTVYSKDGNVKLQREVAGKRDSKEVIVVDDGAEMSDE